MVLLQTALRSRAGPTCLSGFRLRPDLVRALRRTAALYDCGFLLQLECRGTRRGVDVVTIRARTVRSHWSWKVMTKKSDGVPVRKVLLIDAGRCRESTPEAAPADAKMFFGAGPDPIVQLLVAVSGATAGFGWLRRLTGRRNES
jgi:hypothetical protein